MGVIVLELENVYISFSNTIVACFVRGGSGHDIFMIMWKTHTSRCESGWFFFFKRNVIEIDIHHRWVLEFFLQKVGNWNCQKECHWNWHSSTMGTWNFLQKVSDWNCQKECNWTWHSSTLDTWIFLQKVSNWNCQKECNWKWHSSPMGTWFVS